MKNTRQYVNIVSRAVRTLLMPMCIPNLLVGCAADADVGLYADVEKQTAAVVGCPPPGVVPTFDQFRDCTTREVGTNYWVIDGDRVVRTESELLTAYNEIITGSFPVTSGLAVHTVNGVDSRWTAQQACALTYCVSTAFGDNYKAVVAAMQAATGAWESAAGVEFTHNISQDKKCNAKNTSVTFDIRPTSGQRYVARAFFPHDPRAQRNILVDSSAFGAGAAYDLTGVLRHELGHALGFRHEHTRPDAGVCFEDNSWRPLTPYDSASVMHYPQCNGTGGKALQLTKLDAQGARALYGAQGRCTPAYGVKVCEFNDPTSGTTPGCQQLGVGAGGGTVSYAVKKDGELLMYVQKYTDPYGPVYSCKLSGSSSSYRLSGDCNNYRVYAN